MACSMRSSAVSGSECRHIGNDIITTRPQDVLVNVFALCSLRQLYSYIGDDFVVASESRAAAYS
eukprot:6035199-Amphidinium_carterae.2